MATATSTVDVQGQLLEIDNLIKGLQFLYEEIESRKEKALSVETIHKCVETEIRQSSFLDAVASRIMRIDRDHSPTDTNSLTRNIAIAVMSRIDADIQALINVRVESKLKSLGVI